MLVAHSVQGSLKDQLESLENLPIYSLDKRKRLPTTYNLQLAQHQDWKDLQTGNNSDLMISSGINKIF